MEQREGRGEDFECQDETLPFGNGELYKKVFFFFLDYKSNPTQVPQKWKVGSRGVTWSMI